MNNIQISNMSHSEWVIYKKQNKNILLNSYPNYNFSARLEIMTSFKKILQEENIELFLSGGTLLGCHREGNFIPWDPDVDMDVFAEQLIPKFDIIKSKLVDLGYIVRSIDQYPNMKINVYNSGEKIGILALYLNPDTKMRYRYRHKWPARLYESSQLVIFKNIEFRAPEVLGYLEHTYGKNWGVPMRKNYFNKDLFR